MYVLVDGQKFRDRNRLPELVKKRLAILDFGQERLKDTRYTAAFAPGEIEALGQRIEAARRRYEEVLASR